MSYVGLPATRWAWVAEVSSSSERLVLLALAKHAADDGDSYPSVETLAEETKLNRKTVFSAIASLCDAGFVVRTVRSGSRGRRNYYELCLDRTENGSTENGTTQIRNDPKTERTSSQKRYFECTENGTLKVPKLGHEYRREERSEERSEKRMHDAREEPPSAVEVPQPLKGNKEIEPGSIAPAKFPLDDVPFPEFEGEDLSSDSLFAMELLEQERAKQTAAPDPTPTPAAEKPKAKRDAKRGTRLTIKTLPDEWRAYCEEREPDLDPDLLFEEFFDYWSSVPGQKGLKLDWFATWRRYVKSFRNAEDWKRRPMLKSSAIPFDKNNRFKDRDHGLETEDSYDFIYR